MIIFDFSGTLSLDAVLFGRAERLTQALRDSGLWQLGLNSVAMFWRDVVAPTWDVGATTSIGYAGALTTVLKRLLDASETDIRRCASAFAAHYIAHLTIHAAWTPILQKLCADPAICVMIATDHYADATGQIRAQFDAINIPARSILETPQNETRGVFMANSADIGAIKAERAFWERVRTCFVNEFPSRIALVDDFGANEPAYDTYAAEDSIAARRTKTTAILADVFRCPIKIFPFAQPNPQVAEIENEFAACVARTAAMLTLNEQ